MKDSGIPWIGEIPSDWGVEQLSGLFIEHKNKNSDLSETNLLSLSYGKIIRKDINTKEGLLPQSFDGYNVIEKGDIVFRLTDLQNDKRSLRTGLCTERGIITSAYVTLRKRQDLDSAFFHYLFHSYDICKVFYGLGDGVRQGMNYSDLRKLAVLYPPLPTQQRIADYLDRKCAEIDELAALQQTMIAELKRYKQSVITEAVTKGLDPNVAMKDSGVEWIGEIPEGWDVRQIKRYAKVNNGKEIIVELPANTPNAKPVYGSGGIFKYTNDILFNGEAVLFGRKGTLGKPLYVNGEFWVVDTMYYLTFDSALFPKYAYYELMAFDWIPFITHTAIPSVVASDVVASNVPIPPLTEQRAIADYLDKKCAEIDELIAIKQQKIEALKEYKKSVIFEYVTGKKEVL